MAESGHFSADVPATLRGTKRAPAMTPAELVDRHNITRSRPHPDAGSPNREVRSLPTSAIKTADFLQCFGGLHDKPLDDVQGR